MTHEPLIQLTGISAAYDRKQVLTDVNLTVYEKDFLGVIGPNGGGKTTLMKVILGLLKPVHGTIRFFRHGKEVPEVSIGYLPQYNHIDKKFPISVYEVVLSGLNKQKSLFSRFTAEQHRQVERTIARMGLEGLEQRAIGQLSGGQLQRALLENTDCWALYKDFMNFDTLESALKAWQATLPEGTAVSMSLLSDQLADGSKTAGALHEALEAASRTLYGNYNGALNIYNLPTSLMAAITAAVIPAVSGTLARRDRKGASRVAGSALRISALLAFPMGVGLYVLGKPIMALIFPSLTAELAGPLLSTLGLATVFVCMMLVCNSILQAYGFVNLPVIIMLAGGVIKIVLNYNVVVLPQVGIYGAPLGNIFCFALCLILDLIVMARVIPGCPKYIPLFAKPAAAAAVMGLGAWAVHGLLAKLFAAGRMGNAVSTLAAILVAVVIYGVLVIVLRAITKEDLALMPKGEKIARILHLS